MAIKPNDFINKLKKLERDISTSRLLKTQIARKAKELIYKRTKTGFGVNATDKDTDQTQTKKLKPLKKTPSGKSYVDYRRRVKRDGKFKTGKFFAISRSNLTLTGQMLESINFSIDANGIKVFIPNSEREDGKNTNAEIARYVQANDREFFALTKDDLKILVAIYDDFVTKKIKELF